MPKAKWGAGDNPLTAADIDGAEQLETRTRYSGEVPRGGTYRYTLQSMKQAVSGNGNDKVVLTWNLDGSWKPNHKEYDGAPLWHHLALTKANDKFVRNFLDSIGATAADLMNNALIDENGYITKLGRVGDPVGLQCYITTKRRAVTKEYPDPSLEVTYGGYLPINEDDEADAAGTDEDAGEAPF